MTVRQFIYQGTADNYASLVLANSHKGPVLVHFWVPWAGPCMMLKPALARLVDHYRGRLLLVEVNTDVEKGLARDQGVVSIPYLKMFRKGKVACVSRGGQPEAELRKVIDSHIGLNQDPIHAEALRSYQRGELEGSLRLLGQAAQRNPEDTRPRIDQAKILLRHGRAADADRVLSELPAAQRAPAVTRLLAHVRFARAAAEAPTVAELEARLAVAPDDCAARFQLGSLRLFDDDYEGAMEELLEILRLDPHFGGDAATAGLLAIFDLLGEDNALVKRYRSRMVGTVG